jgi:hypothetical protein
MLHFYTMQRILEITKKYDAALAQKKNKELEKLSSIYFGRGGNFNGE